MLNLSSIKTQECQGANMRNFFAVFILIYSLQASTADLRFPKDFLFGISNAPSQVEDQLPNTWTKWAAKGKIAAYHNRAKAKDRILFWTNPEIEIEWAKRLGVQVFRLGVSWQRLEPQPGEYNFQALTRYRRIIKLIRKSGMKVMLTLFHHSEPSWTLANGSWSNPIMTKQFIDFSNFVLKELGPLTDYLITFNEPNIYLLLGQVSALWPSPFPKPKKTAVLPFWPMNRLYYKSLDNMAQAHKQLYDKYQGYQFKIGLSQNVAIYKARGLLGRINTSFANKMINLKMLDLTIDKSDFIGVNYYGLEWTKGFSPAFSKKMVYSDSARAIYPKGLYDSIVSLNKKYNKKRKTKIPFFITENGVADDQDSLRPSYIIEHLHAIHQSISENIPVLGYIHWTITDNWEWSDGYCPKFGLLRVSTKDLTIRYPRKSFWVYQKIAKTKSISQKDRDRAWRRYLVSLKKPRPMCRAKDAQGSLDLPRFIPMNFQDWRFFNH